MKHTLTFLLLAFLTSSCLIRFSYKKNPTGLNYLSEEIELADDTIFVQNFFLCKRHTYGFFDLPGRQVEIDADSAWAFFRAALENQPMQVIFEEGGQSYCDSLLAVNRRLKRDEIDLAWVKEWGHVQADQKLRLVPIVLIEYLFRNHVYATPAGFDGGGTYRDIRLKIQPYLFKGDQLIFARGMLYISDVDLITYQDFEAPVTTLEQKHWDELIRLVMKPYVKQLEDQ